MAGELNLDPRAALGNRRIAMLRPAARAAYLAAAGLDEHGRPVLAPPASSLDFARLLASRVNPGTIAPTAIDAIINQAAVDQQLDPALVRAVAQVESGFNPRAVSPAGAKGIMQLMDPTARSLGVRDPFDAAQNVSGGVRYLRQMLQRFGGDERLALAAYNAGPGAVLRHGGVPPFPETQRYVSSVLALRDRLGSQRAR